MNQTVYCCRNSIQEKLLYCSFMYSLLRQFRHLIIPLNVGEDPKHARASEDLRMFSDE